jgi:hypothetical protein
LKTNKILAGIALGLFILLIIPTLPAFAGSASCSGSPITCVLSDAFSFLDNTPSITLGKIVSGLTDSFHFADSLGSILIGVQAIPFSDSFHFSDVLPGIVISTQNGNPCNNPFDTSTTCNPQQGIGIDQYIDTSTPVGIAITQVGIPASLLIACMIVPAKWGVKSFYIIFPIANFVILALSWVQVLPTWFIPLDIVVVSGGVAFIVIQLFTGSNSSNTAEG